MPERCRSSPSLRRRVSTSRYRVFSESSCLYASSALLRAARIDPAISPSRPSRASATTGHVRIRGRRPDAGSCPSMRQSYSEVYLRPMKRSERHRLKENQLSHALSEAGSRLAKQQRTYGTVAAIIVVVVLIAGGYWAWHT